MTALAGPYMAFDTETTGINVETDRIVTTCTALLAPPTEPGRMWTQEIRSQLLAVDIDIPEEATAVHGVTTKHARDHGEPVAPALNRAAEDLTRAMLAKIPVVACNAAYDFTILDRELCRNELPTLEERLGGPISPVIDVLVLDKHADPYRRGSRKLVDMAAHYGVPFEGAHDSTIDALAAARIAYRMHQVGCMSPKEIRAARKRGVGWPVLDRVMDEDVHHHYVIMAQSKPEVLHREQVQWRVGQQEGSRKYFLRQGKPADDVRPEWPLIPYAVVEGVVVDG